MIACWADPVTHGTIIEWASAFVGVLMAFMVHDWFKGRRSR